MGLFFACCSSPMHIVQAKPELLRRGQTQMKADIFECHPERAHRARFAGEEAQVEVPCGGLLKALTKLPITNYSIANLSAAAAFHSWPEIPKIRTALGRSRWRAGRRCRSLPGAASRAW